MSKRGTGDQVLEDNQELISSELGKSVVGGRQRQSNMAKHKRKVTAAEKAEKKRGGKST